MVDRRIIYVSGAPGAGKTTLAKPLARRLGMPLFSKDLIKEVLTDSLGESGGDLDASRRLGGAAMEVIWSLAVEAPAAVLEANFRPRSAYERGRLTNLGATLVELHCDCGPEEAARRFRARAAAGQHAAHPLAAMPSELLAEYDRPVGLGTLIGVNTREPVEIEHLAERIRSALAD